MAGELTAKVAELTAAFKGAQLRGITTRVAARSAKIVTGGISPAALSRHRGGPVKARFDIVSDGKSVLKPTPAGLGVLLELGSGTTWKPRRSRSYTRRPVPPRGAWSKGVATMTPHVVDLVRDEVAQVLGRVF